MMPCGDASGGRATSRGAPHTGERPQKCAKSAAGVERGAPALSIHRVAGEDLASGGAGALPGRALEEAAFAAALAGLVGRELRLVDVLGVILIAERLGERVARREMRQILARSLGSVRPQSHQRGRGRYGGGREEGAARGIRIVLGQ